VSIFELIKFIFIFILKLVLHHMCSIYSPTAKSRYSRRHVCNLSSTQRTHSYSHM